MNLKPIKIKLPCRDKNTILRKKKMGVSILEYRNCL